MPPVIIFENVCYSYPGSEIKVLNKLNFSVAQGEFLAVMGKTGAGKTTFCKLINGIIPHISGGKLSGTVTVDGECTDKSSVPRLALKTGMVLDDPDAQIFTSTVRYEVAFGPENLLLPPQEIEQRVEMALRSVGLEGFEHRQPSTLSGGEKQRLAIACALAMKGKILVLDEPLCRLDPQGVEDVMLVLQDVREKYKLTVVMTTHDSRKMLKYADRVCVLNSGCLISVDTAGKIFSDDDLLQENGIQPPADTDIQNFFDIYSEKLQLPQEISTEIPPQPSAIQIVNFSYRFENSDSYIENINLTVADNDFIALIGSNGCGKTTLLKSITGLLRPDSGDIFIRGKNTKEISVSSISHEAGFVMQNPDNQLFTGSVYDEVAYALKNAGYSKDEIRSRVNNALKTTGLDNADAFPHALGRTDRTLLVVACVLAMGCRIILFDEVDVCQDYRGSRKIMNIARELHTKGYTIVFVTHNMSLVCEYAGRLIMMERNRIVNEWKKKK